MTKAVALILDPNFGSGIIKICHEMPTWVISSPANDAVVLAERGSFPEGHVTLLLQRPHETSRDLLARAMFAIDEHHGEESQKLPYDKLRIVGANEMPASELVQELKFKSIHKTEEGFEMNK